MFLVALAAMSARAQVRVTTVDGTSLTGTILAWTVEGLTVSIEGQATKIAADRLLRINAASEPAPSNAVTARLELVDGTVLPLSDYQVVDHWATATMSLTNQPLKIPTNDIRLLQFAPFEDRVSKLWKELSAKQLEGDLLIVHKKKRTTVDFLTGLLGDVSDKQVAFLWDGDQIPVKLSKVAALGYFHANEPELPNAICWLKTTDNASLPVASILLDREMLQLTTLGGIEFQLPLGSVLEADYSLGKLVYLSDLQPIRQQWTPQIELPKAIKLINNYGAARQDQSFAGSILTLKWPEQSVGKTRSKSLIKSYPKGLALRSRTKLEYRIPPQMRRFIAIAGIDPATASQGHVRLEIADRDQVLWEGEIDGSLPPTEIQVDLNGARQLRIFVDFGANLDFGDRLHLVEARVTK